MLEAEGICEEGKKGYEEKQRLLVAWLMSEKGGMPMEGATDAKNKKNNTNSSRT